MTGGSQYQVAIVGFGPAGAIAACWLGQAGIKTLVVEKSRTIWDIPRAIALDHEILRVFQNIGVVDLVLPHTAPFGESEHYGAKGQLIRRIGVMSPPYPLGYLPNMVFTQPPVEQILRDRAIAHTSVTVSLGLEVTAIAQDESGAVITLRDEAGQASSVRSQYVIGCDGASSTVRRQLNIPLEDLGFDEPWLVVDVLVNDSALSKLPAVCAQFCDPARPYTYIIGPGNHRRWEIMLNDGEDPREIAQEDRVWQLLSRWLDPADGRLWRASSYRFHALVAASWRNGRVFLAGDSAHQQPPFIGQGMCQGIRDVTNLCWKLISVLRGESCESLLDSYEPERKQHVTTLTTRIKQIGATICIRNIDAARRRDEELLRQGGGEAPLVTRQQIVPPLQAGLLGTGPAAGTIFPQPRIKTAEGSLLMDEISGPGWLLVVDGRNQEDLQPINTPGIQTIVIGGDGHLEMDGVVAEWFDTHHCKVSLIRPDHYVFRTIADLHKVSEICTELNNAIALDSSSALRH